MRELLVFAKEPRRGAVKTRLAASIGDDAASLLYRAFLEDVSEMLSGLEGILVTWWIHGRPEELRAILRGRWKAVEQPSGELGQRLTAAFDASFRQGRGPVAVIGTDCPLLTPGHVEQVFEHLERGADAALIPAHDGGYAALGLRRPCPAVFAAIPWSTDQVLPATLEALQRAGLAAEVLGPVYDIDDRASLERLAEDLRVSPGLAPHTASALVRLNLGGPRQTVVDALGRTIRLEPLPQRVVSLVPSVTECLFDAGLGDRLAGRTDYCVSPPEAAALPSVGGPKTVDVKAVLRLAPDLVLANAEENDKEQVEALAAHGLRVHVAFPRSLGAVVSLLADLGLLLGARDMFLQFARDLEETAAHSEEPAIPCACLIWKDPLMTACRDTLTSAILEAAGCQNVFAGRTGARYPSVSLEELIDAAPRLILLPSEPYAFTAEDAEALTAAVPGAAAIPVPGEWVTWYGSRVAEAIRGLKRVLESLRQPARRGPYDGPYPAGAKAREGRK